MMMLLVLGMLALLLVVGTIVTVRRDGYRQVPTRYSDPNPIEAFTRYR